MIVDVGGNSISSQKGSEGQSGGGIEI